MSGPLVLDDPRLMLQAALADVGIAFAIEEEVAEHLAAGRLERVLADWCAPFPVSISIIRTAATTRRR